MVNMRTTRRGRAAWCLQSGDAKSVADEAKKSKLEWGSHSAMVTVVMVNPVISYTCYYMQHMYIQYILYVYNLYLCIDV